MMYVPILNDRFHAHLTQADWALLAFPLVAVDVIQLFLHSPYIIPESAKTVLLDTRIRSCHKVSKQKGSTHSRDEFFLYSPYNGQKMLIAPEAIHEKTESFFKKFLLDIKIINADNDASFAHYDVSDKAGNDGAKGFLYSKKGMISIQDAKWADIIEPIDEGCGCYTCQYFTLSYLHHLNNVGVSLAQRLGILHNLYHCNQRGQVPTGLERSIVHPYKAVKP